MPTHRNVSVRKMARDLTMKSSPTKQFASMKRALYGSIRGMSIFIYFVNSN